MKLFTTVQLETLYNNTKCSFVFLIAHVFAAVVVQSTAALTTTAADAASASCTRAPRHAASVTPAPLRQATVEL